MKPARAIILRTRVSFAVLVIVVAVAVGIGGGCTAPAPVEACTLEPCNIDDGDEPNDANTLCDLQVTCDSFLCLSYRADGNNVRRPFCSEPCTPDPADAQADCPAGWVCDVVAEVVGPDEPSNCTVEVGGVDRDSRCACVPCEELDPALCP